MHDWTVVLSSHLSSGVYSLDTPPEEKAVQALSERNGLDFTVIDLRAANGRADLLAAFAGALDFPAYFGGNWDALYDCLTDMSWRPARGYALLLVGLEGLSAREGDELALLAGLLRSVVDFRRRQGVPFYVVLSG